MTLGAVRAHRPTSHRAERTTHGRREFHDVRHPLQPGFRVESVIVCSSGVHVVTRLPHADGAADAVLLAVGHTAADLVRSLLPQRYGDRVRPVLCLTTTEPIADLVDGVLVTTADTLEHILRSSPVVLSTSEVNDVALRLDARLEPFPVVRPAPERRRRRRGLALAAATVAAVTAVGALLDQVAGVLPLPW